MPYRDPHCVLVAQSLGEADVVATWLGQNNIRAEVMNRNTYGGHAGVMPINGGVGINGVEVWVLDPEQVPQAIELLTEQELLRTTRTAAREVTGEPVTVNCEDCGNTSTFPPAQRGSVQDCPHCGAYLDVGEDEELETDESAEDKLEDPPSDGIQRPSPLRPGNDE